MTSTASWSATVLAALFVALLAGCTWVKPTAAAQNVTIAPAVDAERCQRLGVISSRTKDTIGWDRNRNKVRTELETLARNEAAVLGANTIVPVGEPEEGAQSFHAWFCPDQAP